MLFARSILILTLSFGAMGVASFPFQAAAAQENANMREAFDVLSTKHRKRVQEVMKLFGHYTGPVDGSYGPGTEKAIPLLAAYLEDIASGELEPPKFPLENRVDVTKLFGYIISGQADIYIYRD